MEMRTMEMTNERYRELFLELRNLPRLNEVSDSDDTSP